MELGGYKEPTITKAVPLFPEDCSISSHGLVGAILRFCLACIDTKNVHCENEGVISGMNHENDSKMT